MRTLLAITIAITVGCTEVSQVTNPSSVDVDVSTPTVDVGTTPPPETPPNPGSPVSIAFNPSSVEGTASSTVWVLVIIRDASGAEVPSASITVSGLDASVVQFNRRDGRQLNFSLVAAGTTTATITASGAQATLVFTVN